MKMLRAIRLDPSDTFIFPQAAEPGDILTPGSFVFWRRDIATLAGKEKSAFRSGFLSVQNGGFSTLAQVCEITVDEYEQAVHALAALLVRDHGAPSLEAALPAAREEMAASQAIAQHEQDILIAMHRSVNEQGEIVEQFRTLQRRAVEEKGFDARHARAFTFFESEDAAAEPVDFAALMEKRNV